jgi:hypothetical protein
MRVRFCLIVLASFWMAGGSTACADDRGEKPFRCYMLQYPTVQKELELSAEKSAEINALSKACDAALWKQVLQGSPPDLKNVTGEERIKRIQESSRADTRRNRKLLAEFVPRFEKQLDSGQRQRLRQLDWQFGWRTKGGRALRDPELEEAIGLSEKQRGQLVVIDDKFKDKEDHLLYSTAPQGSPEESKVIAEMERLYPDWNQAMAALLSKEQRQKLEAAMGKPIDVPQLLEEMKQRQNQVR